MQNDNKLPRLETLAQRLRWARVRQGLKQGELAAMVDSTQDQISKIELGKSERPRNIKQLARALEVPLVWLEIDPGDLEKLSSQGFQMAMRIDSLDDAEMAAVEAFVNKLASNKN